VHAQSKEGGKTEDPIATHTLTQVYRHKHRRYIIIGDVHGCHEELVRLLSKCEYSKKKVGVVV
jgi:hypothetical protein